MHPKSFLGSRKQVSILSPNWNTSESMDLNGLDGWRLNHKREWEMHGQKRLWIDVPTTCQLLSKFAEVELHVPPTPKPTLVVPRQLGLEDILDLQLIALSNEQTRRARIVGAVMKPPLVLLLDEPLSECFCRWFFSFFSPPVAVHLFHTAISFLPLPRSFLSISSSPFSPRLSFCLVFFPPCALAFPGPLPLCRSF